MLRIRTEQKKRLACVSIGVDDWNLMYKLGAGNVSLGLRHIMDTVRSDVKEVVRKMPRIKVEIKTRKKVIK